MISCEKTIYTKKCENFVLIEMRQIPVISKAYKK